MADRGAGCGKAACPVLRGAGVQLRPWVKYCGTAEKPGGKQRKQTLPYRQGSPQSTQTIPKLLEMLCLEGSLVTIDAMGCQKAIAESILQKGADYLLAVKENQPKLYEAIDRLFFDSDDEVFTDCFSDYAENPNRDHGREERRRCWVCYDLSTLQECAVLWQGLKALVVIESHRTVGNQTTIEHRLYISSSRQSAAYFLKATRDHWHVENKLHWVLDVAFREDESRLRKGDGAENFSVLRRIALNLLKKEKTEKTGIENKRCRAGWDQDYLERVLSGLQT